MTFYYLATPYSKYPEGQEAAFRGACVQSGLLLEAKIPTFSPVVYGHPMALAAKLDPLDHDMWMTMSRGFMPLAHGIIICKMESWESPRACGRKYIPSWRQISLSFGWSLG